MKRILLLLLIPVTILKVSAQDTYTAPSNYHPVPQNSHSPAPLSSDSLPGFYLGIGTGINNYVGLIGVGVDLRVYKPLLLRAGLGIGTWGAKYTIGVKYEFYPGRKGWALGLSYSYCTGLKNFQEQLQVDTASTTVTKEVPLTLNPVSTVNITASYSWVFHKYDKFYIETGLSLSNQQNPYVVNNADILTSTSQQTLKTLSPGGLVIACGVMFGL